MKKLQIKYGKSELFTWKWYAHRILFWARAFEIKDSMDGAPDGIMHMQHGERYLLEREQGWARLMKGYSPAYQLSPAYFVPHNAIIQPFVCDDILRSAFKSLLDIGRIIPCPDWNGDGLPHWTARCYNKPEFRRCYFMMILPDGIDMPDALRLIEKDFSTAFQDINLRGDGSVLGRDKTWKYWRTQKDV